METSRTNPFKDDLYSPVADDEEVAAVEGGDNADAADVLGEQDEAATTPGHMEMRHIKEWVTEKLKELEQQNCHLKAENRRFTEELAQLKKCYNVTSSGNNNTKKAYTPEVRRKVTVPSTPMHRRAVDRPNTARRYNSSQRIDTTTSSDDEAGRGEDEEFFVTRPKKLDRFQPRPMPRGQRQLKSQLLNSPMSSKNVVGPTIEGDSIRLLSGNTRQLVHSSRTAGSLDRKLTKVKRFNFNESKAKQSSADSQNLYDIVGGDLSQQQQQQQQQQQRQQSPPTPPRHRCPSWESRIYAVANNGFTSTLATPRHKKKKVYEQCQAIMFTSPPGSLPPPPPPPPSTRRTPLQQLQLQQQQQEELENSSNKVESSSRQQQQHDEDVNILPIFSHSNGRLKLLGMNSYHDDGIVLTSDIDGDFRANGSYFRPSRSFTSSGNESDFAPLEPPKPFRGDGDGLPATTTFESSFDSLKQANVPITPTNDPIGGRLAIEGGLKKCGTLLKLGGRFRSWKRRWFLLQDECLYYYKTEKDFQKGKLKEKIELDTGCKVVRSKEDSKSFQLVYKEGKKSLQLAGETITSFNEWIKAINQTMTFNNIFRLQLNQMPIIEDQLVKVRFGHQVRCWVCLYETHLVYYSTGAEKIPLGSTMLKDAKVTEIDESEVGADEDKAFSLSIHTKDDDEPIYLLFNDSQTSNLWLHHLKTAATGGHQSTRTAFENFLGLLHAREGTTSSRQAFYCDTIWGHEALVYSETTPSGEPMTSLPTPELRTKALKLFNSIKLFITISIDMVAIDYHVSLVQNLIKVALENVELQSELYYQLIKQSTPPMRPKGREDVGNAHHIFPCSPNIFHCEGGQQTSPTNSESNSAAVSRSGSQAFGQTFLQCTKLLSIVVSIFLPSSQVLWLLRHHLKRSQDPNTEAGKYAVYCERALDRTLANGGRKEAPSRMEVLSILQRNPFQHCLPHSIPVHFANDSYQVIGFDGSTTVKEFCRQINSESGIRDNIFSGFALYSDDPVAEGELTLLNLNSKLADVIASWEEHLRKYRLGRFETTRIVKLVYRHRLCLKRYLKNETDKERLLWVYEIIGEIVKQRFPITFELAVELMALLMQIEFGDIAAVANFEAIYTKALERFMPTDYCQVDGLRDMIMRKWSESSERSALDCVRIFLNCTRRWRLCGARLYRARVSCLFKYDDLVSLQLCKLFNGIEASSIWIAVIEGVIELLEMDTFQSILAIPREAIINFGGYRSHFMLVVNANLLRKFHNDSDYSVPLSESKSGHGQRLLFQMDSKKTIVDITMLLADYINTSTCTPFQ